MRALLLGAAIAAISPQLLATPAMAGMTFTSQNMLNMRTGPRAYFPTTYSIPPGEQAALTGCVTGRSWCYVEYKGRKGWVDGDYVKVGLNSDQKIKEAEAYLPVPEAPYSAVSGRSSGVVDAFVVEEGVDGQTATIVSVLKLPSETVSPPRNVLGKNIHLDGEAMVSSKSIDPVDLRMFPELVVSYVSQSGPNPYAPLSIGSDPENPILTP